MSPTQPPVYLYPEEVRTKLPVEGLAMEVAASSACASCKREPESTLVCSRCKLARYCDKDCQKSHFSSHKRFCIARGKDLRSARIRDNWNYIKTKTDACRASAFTPNPHTLVVTADLWRAAKEVYEHLWVSDSWIRQHETFYMCIVALAALARGVPPPSPIEAPFKLNVATADASYLEEQQVREMENPTFGKDTVASS